LAELAEDLVPGDDLVRAGGGLDRLRGPLLVERVHLPAPGGDAAVDGHAPGDRVEPGGEPAGAPEAVEALVDAEEDLLGEVGRLLPVAADAQAPGGHLRVVPPVEDGEAGVGARGVPPRRLDQLLVAQAVQIHGGRSSERLRTTV